MVAPITGPFVKTEIALGPAISSGFRPEWSWFRRAWYRQGRPYNLPLAFHYTCSRVLTWSGTGSEWDYRHYYMNDDSIHWITPNPATHFPNAYNTAYDRLKSQLSANNAGLGISLAQRKQALAMIESRSMQLFRFVNRLRKLDIRGAAKALGIKKVPPRWQLKGKPFADLFLEFHFGWSPLIGDIGSAIDVLQDGVPPARIRTSAGFSDSYVYHTSLSSSPYYYRYGTDKGKWLIGCDVQVTNPNLWLANQLGFVNPAQVAWDMVPFSFVLGWFVNVDQFLGSFTDLYGVSIQNPYITCHWVRNSTEDTYLKHWPKYGTTTLYTTGTFVSVITYRIPGSIPGPTLRVKDPWILSPTRAATAVSLLLQKLK